MDTSLHHKTTGTRGRSLESNILSVKRYHVFKVPPGIQPSGVGLLDDFFDVALCKTFSLRCISFTLSKRHSDLEPLAGDVAIFFFLISVLNIMKFVKS